MSVDPTLRPLIWIASSLDDLKQFPAEVRSLMGYALYLGQCGLKHEHAKPLRGFGGAGVLEIVQHFDGNSYRAVYTVRFAERVVRPARVPEDVEARYCTRVPISSLSRPG